MLEHDKFCNFKHYYTDIVVEAISLVTSTAVRLLFLWSGHSLRSFQCCWLRVVSFWSVNFTVVNGYWLVTILKLKMYKLYQWHPNLQHFQHKYFRILNLRATRDWILVKRNILRLSWGVSDFGWRTVASCRTVVR